MDISDVLASIARSEFAPLTLVGRCAGGESTGAYLVDETRTGRTLVLKWTVGDVEFRLRQHEQLATLRDRGYPIPRHDAFVVDNSVITLQERIPAEPATVLTPRLARGLLDLNAMQLGLGDGTEDFWRGLLAAEFLADWDGLRRHSSSSARLLARIREVAASPDLHRTHANDLVHYDFHLGNILSADGDTPTAVVDWDGIRSGDALCDIALLAVGASRQAPSDAVEPLWDHLTSADAARARVAGAHASLHIAGWVVDHRSREWGDIAVRAGHRALDRVGA